MRILLSSLYFYPEVTGIGVYSYDFAKYLVECGHDVHVLTSFPFYPTWKKFGNYPPKIFYDETIDGITVHRCFAYVPRHPTSLKRIIHEVVFACTSFLRGVALREDINLICTISPPLTSGISTFILSRIKRSSFIFHIQDLLPEAAIDLKMLSGKWMKGFLFSIAKFIYKRADFVSAIGMGMLNRLKNIGIPEGKLIYFPNWVTKDQQSSLSRGDGIAFRKDFNLIGKEVVVYSGNVGIKHGIDCIIGAANELRFNTKIFFFIAGSGADLERIKEKTKTFQLTNIHFESTLNHRQYANLIAAADIALVTQKKEVIDFAIPSKTLALLWAQKRIIAVAHKESELAQLISKTTAGRLVEPDKPENLAQAILSALEDPLSGSIRDEKVLTEIRRDTVLSKIEKTMVELTRE